MNKALKSLLINITVCTALLVLLVSCGGLTKQEQSELDKRARRALYVYNFDQKKFPNEYPVIAKMISVVKPNIDENERNLIAGQISKAIKIYKVQPQVMVAIIDTESDFRADMVSSTGDVSIAQINVEVWNKEFARMKKVLIDKERLKVDQAYSILKMGEILAIIKKRYGKTDRRWYARYHSNTTHYKKLYLTKLEIRLKQLAESKKLNSAIALN